MPLDHGCRLDQHHDVQGLRPNPVKPHPENTVGAEKPRTARVLAPRGGHLVPKGDDEFQFQRSAATTAKERKETTAERTAIMLTRGRAVTQQSLGYLSIPEF